MPIPPFNADGLLPAGIHEVTIEQLRTSYLVTGEGVDDLLWDAAWRGKLVDNLSMRVQPLWKIGIPYVLVAGSFVERKSHPHDVDGSFPCSIERIRSGELTRTLNELSDCWTWDVATRRQYRGYPKGQLPMWHRYRVELFPDHGQPFGVLDPEGSMPGFEAMFRRTRSGKPKGILRLLPGVSF